MLIEMRFSNFYSIRDEVSIDFKAGNIKTQAAKELADNVFVARETKLLKTLGLFGPNASGKSSIIKAAAFCRQLVIDSHLNNEGDVFLFEPFKFDGYPQKNSFFYIDFITDGIEYEYSFVLNRKEIISEELYYYLAKRRVKVFSRNEKEGAAKNEIYSFGPGLIIKAMDVAQSTGKNTLFISRASQMDRLIPRKIYSFFRQELLIGLPRLTGEAAIDLFKENRDLIIQTLMMADSDIVDIDVKKEKSSDNAAIAQNTRNAFLLAPLSEDVHFYTTHKRDTYIRFNLEEESAGTIRVFNLLLVLLDVCRNGKTLIVDEFDASMHTELARFILDIVNASKQAQMLFTSHNTNLLDIKKLRRDQILFSNKRDDGATEVYSLFDFKDFRENMDAEKCYLQGRFDAIPYITSSIATIRSLIGEG